MEAIGPHPGLASATLAPKVDGPNTDGMLSQRIRADAYRGKRVRFSAWLKTQDAQPGASLWLRLDTTEWQKAWNRLDTPIQGTTDWKRYEYVLDIPQTAQGMEFGFDLAGKGKLWAGDVKLEAVDKTTPVSTPDFDSSPSTPRVAPVNLDFHDGMNGWSRTANGNNTPSAEYDLTLDTGATYKGHPSPRLQAKVETPQGYGALRQDVVPDAFRGKRIRFSAWLKTEDIRDYTGLLLTLATDKKEQLWAMQKTPVQGTTDWKRYEYVLDVPQDARMMMFGVSARGKGKVWGNGFQFEVVGKQTPVTPADKSVFLTPAPVSEFAGDTPRVVALWQLGRAGKGQELRDAAEAITGDKNATPEERCTAWDAVAMACLRLRDYAAAHRALEQFDLAAPGLRIDDGVVAEAQRMKAMLKATEGNKP